MGSKPAGGLSPLAIVPRVCVAHQVDVGFHDPRALVQRARPLLELVEHIFFFLHERRRRVKRADIDANARNRSDMRASVTLATRKGIREKSGCTSSAI